MKAKLFLECSFEGLEYSDGSKRVNMPVNTLSCKGLLKSSHPWKFGSWLPTIEFIGSDITWVFMSKQERDNEYNTLLEYEL
jgi:hypothetical protein